MEVIESYAKLRMNLLYTLVGKESHTVVITSAISGEGKTTIAANLAISCARGGKKVDQLHKETIHMVKATSQAKFADKMLPLLTEEELAYYRRGKNSHVHAVPKSATPAEYAKATGVEALFGALFLLGRKDRANEIFNTVMEANNGL